jgi:hypothetical protein
MTIRFVVQKTAGGRPMPPASGGSRDLGSATLRNWEPPKFTAAVVPANGIFWGGRGLSDGS